jgi:CO/xanthine dehydrogenase FAD-binding subunit
VRVALGSVGPTIIRATEAEETVSAAMATSGVWDDPSRQLPDEAVEAFASLVASAARPLDDVRGTATYRRHACQVLARRSLNWALKERTLPQWL